ncbi:MAG TPA: MHYT domain-containing protein, partial [Acidobacteriaceae bacterium]|nr:MHYT domain-containing protein [Acidobacteriaceae bacterium]
MSSGVALQSSYDYRLVALSVVISICAAYASLDLAERVFTVKGWARLAWLYSGALAMGFGIWTMHYVGLVASHMPIPIWYDWPTVVLSLAVSILASGGALYLVSRPAMGLARMALGSCVMGSGIAAMHFIGMSAMRMNARIVYSISAVLLSIVLTFAISFVAIQVTFDRRHIRTQPNKRKLASAFVMGMAISVMHYAGMDSVTFFADLARHPRLNHAFVITPFGLAAIVATCFFILAHVCFFSSLDRRFLTQNQRLQERQSELEAIFERVLSGIAVLDRKRRLVRLNRAASEQFGVAERTLSFTKAAEVFGALEATLPDGQPLPLELRPSTRALHGDFVRNF